MKNLDELARFTVKFGTFTYDVSIGKDLSDDSWVAWSVIEEEVESSGEIETVQKAYVIARGRAEVQPLALLTGMTLA